MALVADLGAGWEELPGSAALDGYVDAPDGFVWNATGTHVLVVHDLSSRSSGWHTMYEDMELGVSECTEVDCETCGWISGWLS